VGHLSPDSDAHFMFDQAMFEGMNPAELRDYCLSLPGAEQTFPFGPKTSAFKVAGKKFALSQLDADSLRVSLKCEPCARLGRGGLWLPKAAWLRRCARRCA
jgi:hypothetical protein